MLLLWKTEHYERYLPCSLPCHQSETLVLIIINAKFLKVGFLLQELQNVPVFLSRIFFFVLISDSLKGVQIIVFDVVPNCLIISVN